MFLRFGDALDFDNRLMENIAVYMDDEKREKVHFELAPCSNEKFLERYLEMDPDFALFLEDEFGITYEKEEQPTDRNLIHKNIYKSYKNAKQEVDVWFRTAAKSPEMGTRKYDVMECIYCIGKAIALSQVLEDGFGVDTKQERKILKKIKDYLQFDMLDGLEAVS